jgi:hypothetical protein
VLIYGLFLISVVSEINDIPLTSSTNQEENIMRNKFQGLTTNWLYQAFPSLSVPNFKEKSDD